MSFFKNNFKILIGILIGIVLSSGTVYAASYYIASNRVSYDNTTSGLTSENVQSALDELYTKTNIDCKTGYIKKNVTSSSYECKLPGIAQNVNTGDYISLTPEKSSYTISSSLTGHSSDETITPNELTLWRVISKNEDDSIDIVSEYVSSNTVTFSGTRGYANFVGALQTIAQSYKNDKYTKSVRMMGYNGQTLTISDTSMFDGTMSYTHPTETREPVNDVYAEFDGGVSGDTLCVKDINLVEEVYGNIKANTIGTQTLGKYWIASRATSGNSFQDYTFMNRYYYDSTDVYMSFSTMRDFYQGTWSDGSESYALRPIITLKPNINISSGSGTKESPYVLD